MIKIKCPCGKTITATPNQKDRKKYCCKKHFYKFRKRPSGLKYKIVAVNKGWYKKGSRPSQETEFKKGRKNERRGISKGFVNTAGYKEFYRIGKGELEHRLIIEKFIGRKLLKEECVHHINGVRNDNRIENLRIMTRSEHTALHHKQGDING